MSDTQKKELRPVICVSPQLLGLERAKVIAKAMEREGYFAIVAEPEAVKALMVVPSATMDAIAQAALATIRDTDYAQARFGKAIATALAGPKP